MLLPSTSLFVSCSVFNISITQITFRLHSLERSFLRFLSCLDLKYLNFPSRKKLEEIGKWEKEFKVFFRKNYEKYLPKKICIPLLRQNILSQLNIKFSSKSKNDFMKETSFIRKLQKLVFFQFPSLEVMKWTESNWFSEERLITLSTESARWNSFKFLSKKKIENDRKTLKYLFCAMLAEKLSRMKRNGEK